MILFIDTLKTLHTHTHTHTHTHGHTQPVRTTEFREIAENKINIQKPVASLYTDN